MAHVRPSPQRHLGPSYDTVMVAGPLPREPGGGLPAPVETDGVHFIHGHFRRKRFLSQKDSACPCPSHSFSLQASLEGEEEHTARVRHFPVTSAVQIRGRPIWTWLAERAVGSPVASPVASCLHSGCSGCWVLTQQAPLTSHLRSWDPVVLSLAPPSPALPGCPQRQGPHRLHNACCCDGSRVSGSLTQPAPCCSGGTGGLHSSTPPLAHLDSLFPRSLSGGDGQGALSKHSKPLSLGVGRGGKQRRPRLASMGLGLQCGHSRQIFSKILPLRVGEKVRRHQTVLIFLSGSFHPFRVCVQVLFQKRPSHRA